MGEIIDAVYRQGALYPLTPLHLKESAQVRIQVIEERASESKEDTALQALAAAGLITLPPGHSSLAPLSERKRIQLAKSLGRQSGKPVSEMIIEDRGEL